MVHALEEIWRVLIPKGQLIDLRPVSENAPIEVVVGDRRLFAGRRIDGAEGIADDVAANEAMAAAVNAEWFIREYTGSFEYISYWDTPDEMKAYADEKWTSSHLPEEVLAEARRLMADSDEGARVRIRRKIHISQYRKHSKEMSNAKVLGKIA